MKIKSKLWIIAIIILFALAFTACPESPSGGRKTGGNTGGQQQQPTTTSVYITVPSTPEGLNNEGKQITLIFPATGINETRRDAMRDSIIAALPYLDEWVADGDTALGDKLNAALNRTAGLTVTVRVTSNGALTVEVDNKQLRAGSFWLESGSTTTEDIAGEISNAVLTGALI